MWMKIKSDQQRPNSNAPTTKHRINYSGSSWLYGTNFVVVGLLSLPRRNKKLEEKEKSSTDRN